MGVVCLCWEAGLAEQRQHNILPGIQALSSNIAFMIPKTGSAAEAVSVLRQKEQEEGRKEDAMLFPHRSILANGK